MPKSRAKTVRFASVVQSSGRPRTANLWVAPERDKDFIKAERENRVLTIRQDKKTKRDFGQVGFIREMHASYLVFPKSLKKFQSARIVGIKYDLLEAPRPVGPVVQPEMTKRRERKRPVEQRNLFADSVEIPRLNGRERRLGKSSRHSRPTSRIANALPHKEAMHEDVQRKRFRVTVRFNAMLDVEHEVEAQSKSEARQKFEANARTPDFSHATITRRIVRIIPAR